MSFEKATIEAGVTERSRDLKIDSRLHTLIGIFKNRFRMTFFHSVLFIDTHQGTQYHANMSFIVYKRPLDSYACPYQSKGKRVK